MPQKEMLTVGELAKRMNVTVRTLQYYDKENILKPSAMSEGGRRLYSSRDVVRLHQVLSLKYLGFSLEDIKNRVLPLETPGEVEAALEKQQGAVEAQIQNLQAVLSALQAFRKEVSQMKVVNFDRYADIITLLRRDNDMYWVMKLFDDRLSGHVKARFSEQQELGTHIVETYIRILDEALMLKRAGEAPGSEKSVALAEAFWNMINAFTGGDMSLLPQLMAFNEDKSGWSGDMAEKQREIDDYIGQALLCYFEKEGLRIPEMEDSEWKPL